MIPMNEPWTVVVASWKRAGAVVTDRIVRNAKIIVPESQAEEYREKQELRNGAELVVCPDEADGNICRKRNWALDQYPGWVVILDDDVEYIGLIQGGKRRPMDLDEVDQMLTDGFEMCEDLGTVMWGINQQIDPRFYREYTPFSFLSPILGPIHAFCSVDLRYDEAFWSKEDYDIWLRVIQKYRVTLRFNRYVYQADHGDIPGGVVSQRTRESEEEKLNLLVKRYGPEVVKYNLKRSINPKVTVPIKGV